MSGTSIIAKISMSLKLMGKKILTIIRSIILFIQTYGRYKKMGQHMRFLYFSHRQAAKAHLSLCIHAVLPEPSLVA